MKRFGLRLLLVPVLLYSTEHYLLPEQCSDARHTLKQKILRVDKEMFLVTAALRDKALVTAVEKALQKGRRLILVTTSPHLASFFAKYRNTEVRVLKRSSAGTESADLRLNYLLLDDTELCLSTLPFEREAMRSRIGTMQCTLDPETVRFYRRVCQTLAARSFCYLE
jgi:hypothetical protein